METSSKAICRRRSVKSLRTALHQSASNAVQGLCGSCALTMLKADSGVDFPPPELRATPTAFSSAMSGGAQVSAGGDPVNSASWKFTMVFGADGNLTHYLGGAES